MKLKEGQFVNMIFEDPKKNTPEIIATYMIVKVQWVDLKLFCVYSKHMPEGQGEVCLQAIRYMETKEDTKNNFYWESARE